MTKTIGKTFLVGIVFLCLTACTTVTRNAGQSAQEIQDILPTLVDHLNTLQTLESDLQTNWEDDIQADNTLASYAKKEGRVFDNLKQRRELLQQMTRELKTLNDDSKHLANLRGDNLPSAEIQIVVSNSQTIYDRLTEYHRLCSDDITKEEQFFTSLASNQEMDRDTLTTQIQSLNEAAVARQAILQDLNTPLSDIDKPIRILKARLTSQ